MHRPYLLPMRDSLVKEIVVPHDYQGLRVDVVLAQLFPEYSRARLTQWLKDGSITVNERAYKPKDKIWGGESIKLLVNPSDGILKPCTAENIPLTIIFEDDHVMVVNKPANLVVHPGAGNAMHTLVNALLYHAPSLHHLPRAGIIHRLDKDTTGLLLVAKTLTAHTSLIRQMQARTIERHYLALVHGHLIAGQTIDTGYGRHPRNRIKMAVCPQGRQAITQFSIRKQYGYTTLLDVKLMTGRTHQIRVHMAHINHPVVGDPLYGGQARIPAKVSPEERDALHAIKRQALHACTLSFEHPDTGETITLTASLPDDFQCLLTTLDAHLVPPAR